VVVAATEHGQLASSELFSELLVIHCIDPVRVRVFSRISRKEGFDRTERGFFLSHALRFRS